MVYNLYRALLGEVLIAPVVLQKMACQARLGRRTSAGLDPSVRGGTTRLRCPLQHRSSCATSVSSQAHLNGHLPCQRPITPDTAASIASHPASVTIAIRPLLGTRRRHYALFRTKREQKYFSRRGWTGAKHQAKPSCPRSRGSRTPRPLGSIAAASGIRDPRLRGDDGRSSPSWPRLPGSCRTGQARIRRAPPLVTVAALPVLLLPALRAAEARAKPGFAEGMRGFSPRIRLVESPPHPALRADLSPQPDRKRGEVQVRPGGPAEAARINFRARHWRGIGTAPPAG